MLTGSGTGFTGTGCIACRGARSSIPPAVPFPRPCFGSVQLACTTQTEHGLQFTWPMRELKHTRNVLKTERRNTGKSMLGVSLIAGAGQSQNPGNFQILLPCITETLRPAQHRSSNSHAAGDLRLGSDRD